MAHWVISLLPVALLAGPLSLEPTFRAWASCSQIDWRVLRVLAEKESGLRPDYVNAAGYVGLFQTKPENCRRALKASRWEKRCDQLTDPEVNTAVAAEMMAQALTVIEARCPKASLLEQLTLLYVNHNLGFGALRFVTEDESCELGEVRRRAIRYYDEKSPGTARAYAPKFKAECLGDGGTAAQCTGGPKLDFAVETAKAMLEAGVTHLHVASDAGCPR